MPPPASLEAWQRAAVPQRGGLEPQARLMGLIRQLLAEAGKPLPWSEGQTAHIRRTAARLRGMVNGPEQWADGRYAGPGSYGVVATRRADDAYDLERGS